MNNAPVYGCEYCETTAGRMGCPLHRSWVVPTFAPDMPTKGSSPVDRIAALERAQGHLAKLAVERHERILELERELAERPSHERIAKAQALATAARNAEAALDDMITLASRDETMCIHRIVTARQNIAVLKAALAEWEKQA